MPFPDLTSNKRPRLTVISDTLAQPGLLLFSHLLRHSKRKVLYCLENDPDLLLRDTGDEIELVDCWSCHDFDDSPPDLLARPNKRLCVPADRLTGTECELRDVCLLFAPMKALKWRQKDIFVDSLDSLVSAASETRALSTLRTFLDAALHVILFMHADSSYPCLWALTPCLSASLLHLEVHPSLLPTHLQRAYGISPLSNKAYEMLHRLHLRSWAGADFDYAEEPSKEEVATVWDSLGRGGEAFISWSKRMTGGGKIERGVCIVRLKKGDLVWEEPVTHDVQTLPLVDQGFDYARTAEQQADRDGIKLPFGSGGPAVVYEPDANDDFDEDEPDEELEL